MQGDSASVKRLMTSVTVLGLAVLIFAIYKTSHLEWSTYELWVPLVALTVLLSFVKTLKIPGARAQISISDPVIFMGALLFGAYPAAILSAFDSCLQSVKFSRKLSVCAFNVATMTVSICVSALAVNKLFPHTIGNPAFSFNAVELIGPMAMLALIHYFINTTTVAAVVALRQNQSVIRTWFDNVQWSSISYFAGAFTAGFVCFLVKHVGVYGVVSIVPLFASLYFLYKVYLGKVETKNQQVSELSSVYNKVSSAKAEWESTFNAMSDPVFIFDERGKLSRINRAGLAMHKGQSAAELLQRSCCDLGITCDPGICRVRETLITGARWTGEVERREGWFQLRGDPLKDERGALNGVVIILNDITLQKQMREQIIYSEKMATVGQLVSGVGHEINNPLNGIIGYANLALTDEHLSEKTRKHLEIVVSQALRTRKSVQNLLMFARQHKPKKRLSRISEVIQQVLDLRAYEMQVNSITVTQDIEDLPEIMCDAPQLQQVFLNIIVNAEQAMLQAHGRGHLEIKGRKLENKVLISIRDDGPGIEPDNLKHIFEPFFTTKDVGKGAGLGLSICYGIVHEHCGRLFADSKKDQGATFFLELPIGVEAPEQVQAAQKTATPQTVIRQSSPVTETIPFSPKETDQPLVSESNRIAAGSVATPLMI